MPRSPFRHRSPMAMTATRPEPVAPDEPHVELAPVIALHPVPAPVSIVDAYEREHLGLFRFIKGVVREQELAEDLLQEAFLRLVAEMRVAPPENIHAWLYRVATNLAISRGRRTQTMIRHLPQLGTTRHASSPEQRALADERDDALRLALASLPVETRAAVVLASSGFTAREIAGTLGKSEGAVRMHVSRGRLRLRRLIALADVERSTEAS